MRKPVPQYARIAAIVVAAGFLSLIAAASIGSRTSALRALVTEAMAERLDSTVELAAFSVDILPNVRVRGEGLVIRHRGRTDVPPLIQVDAFSVDGGLVGLLSRPRRFRSVVLRGLEINIPPGGLGTGASSSEPPGPIAASPFVIGRLEATDAELRIIPKKAGKDPKVFLIHQLDMRDLGAAERMPFEAELTNPVPTGMIQTSGEFGPWVRGEPGETPLTGRYTFAKADLSTINGIGGTLDSTGEFAGRLNHIAVKGETTTPDFRLDISEAPVALTSRFQAVVDGTDGDTYLTDVLATFGKTSVQAQGSVTGTPGVKGRTVALDVTIAEGRIEDLLRLAVRAEQPLMVGDVALETDFLLPPGEGGVVDRLRLAGAFDVSAQFTDREVQKKLTGMSERARGKDVSGRPHNLVSDLRGKFRLRGGVMSFSNLTFAVPGATVRLAGTYGLRSEALNFDGQLRMTATISEAAGGGLKSFLLKAVDPFFKKGNAGTVLPIKVRGTRQEPKFGLDVVKALTPK
jgi:hypothetical protein